MKGREELNEILDELDDAWGEDGGILLDQMLKLNCPSWLLREKKGNKSKVIVSLMTEQKAARK